uniref:hypothetical protein n=1 Tax=Geothermobacter ehrlichii TaxID=213224 RepID=UPI0011E811CA|nr:hypothetical protein [Geothermobacter ehrlichii]
MSICQARPLFFPARFIEHTYNQTVLLPAAFEDQILPGTFEHTIHYLVDHQRDPSIFDSKVNNDEGGRPAHDPAIRLKIVPLAYPRGILQPANAVDGIHSGGTLTGSVVGWSVSTPPLVRTRYVPNKGEKLCQEYLPQILLTLFLPLALLSKMAHSPALKSDQTNAGASLISLCWPYLRDVAV